MITKRTDELRPGDVVVRGCDVPDCANPHDAKGFCSSHRARFHRHGDPLGGRTSRGEPLAFLRDHLNDDTDECVIWPFATGGKGYGQVEVEGRTTSVHVLACEYHHGPRPLGMEAAHAPVICHNRLCFNGRHLSWKTSAENKADRPSDGTLLVGDTHPSSRLTLSQVAEIRNRPPGPRGYQKELAREFRVSESLISKIRLGTRRDSSSDLFRAAR